jgi:hypothetical protein
MNIGQQIAKEAFDLFADWQEDYAEDLEDIDMVDRTVIYSYWCEGIDIDTAKMMADVDKRS